MEGHRVPPRRRSTGQKAVGGAANAAWVVPATGPHDVWSYDFVSSRTEDGLALRILNVVDEFTRVCLGSRVARSMGAGDVERFLGELFERHGRPRVMRSDNGREFIAQQLADYLEGQGAGQAFIEKASPQQNAYVERFNGTMRDEVLNGETFRSVLEARVVIDAWVEEYNTLRPHRGLGMMTPAAFFESMNHPGVLVGLATALLAERPADLVAQAAHGDIDDIRAQIPLAVPRELQELVARQDPPGTAHERLQDRHLTCAELDRLLAAPHLVRRGIQPQAAHRGTTGRGPESRLARACTLARSSSNENGLTR